VEQVFLIHPENGLLLSHATAPDLPASDGDLISGMLTAIRDFVADSFAREREAGGLRRFSVGELTVMVEQGPRALLAAVVRGQAPDSLLLKLQDTLETIHLQFAEPLADFDGDASTLAGARPLLEECLATVVSTDRTRNGQNKAIWLPWAVATALAIVVFTWLGVKSERRWQRAVGALEAAPGIVLTRAERDGGRWRFAGLRDPLATDPAVLLAGTGADTSRIEGKWEPYLSLQPELVLARVRQRLTPPATVQLALTGETVRLAGSAPLAWIAATSRVTALPAGAVALDLTGLSSVLPPELEALEREIEGERVQFEIGSSLLDAAGWNIARRVARAFARLEAGVAAAGARATLELVGRTDATGTDAANQALSRERAESVNAALGLGRGLVRVNAVGTGDPLGAADPAEQARINRSVSFGVTVGMDSDAGERAR